MMYLNSSPLLFLSLLALKGMKVNHSLGLLYSSHPSGLVFLLPPDAFLFSTSSTVNFTVEVSEVLSVVIVLVFNSEYFNLHILWYTCLSTTGWKPHQLFFLSLFLSV